MQCKLHHWAVADSGRCFDDVVNLVHHPDFLTVAWDRVSGNKGARTAGIDRVSPASIAEGVETVEFLGQVREQLKSRSFVPLPVRERLIPKPGSSKLRRLGIPTAMDRVVQASLVLVLEPISEADFKPVSYGFRPRRRAQDAIAEIHTFGSRNYHPRARHSRSPRTPAWRRPSQPRCGSGSGSSAATQAWCPSGPAAAAGPDRAPAAGRSSPPTSTPVGRGPRR